MEFDKKCTEELNEWMGACKDECQWSKDTRGRLLFRGQNEEKEDSNIFRKVKLDKEGIEKGEVSLGWNIGQQCQM